MAGKSERAMSFAVTLLSFFAIIISFFTLNEMKKQRDLSLEPNLFFNKVDPFEIEYELDCDSCYYVRPTIDGQEQFSLLNLVNVGSGNAVNVTVDWDINFDQFREKLLKFEVDTNLIQIIDSDDMISVKYNSDGGTGSTNSAIRSYHTSHIYTGSSDSDGLTLDIPSHCLLYTSPSPRDRG